MQVMWTLFFVLVPEPVRLHKDEQTNKLSEDLNTLYPMIRETPNTVHNVNATEDGSTRSAFKDSSISPILSPSSSSRSYDEGKIQIQGHRKTKGKRYAQLRQFKITPEKVDVTVGKYFVLTCQTNTKTAFDHIQWRAQRNDQGNYLTMKRDERYVHELTYTIQDSPENLYSVANVTKENEGKFNSRIDYNFTCGGGEVKVSIHPVDYRVRDGLLGTGVVVLVLSVSLIIFYFWRRRKLRAALTVVSQEVPLLI